jgi:hypothetical protein
VNKLVWLVALLVTLSPVAAAQQFTVAFQFSTATPTPFSVFNGRSQMEWTYLPVSGVSVGARLNVESVPLLSQFAARLQTFGMYHLGLYGDGLWSVSGYTGLQLGGYYSPGISSATGTTTTPTAPVDDDHGGGGESSGPGSSGSGSSGSGSSKNETEVEDKRGPGGVYKPTQVLEFSVMTLSGVDAAYFINEQFSAYFGLEVDVLLYPTQTPTAYPYFELDYQVLDNLSLAFGGYVSLNPSTFGYNVYSDAFYTVLDGLTLRLEVGFNGTLYSFLRFAYNF